MRQIVSLCRVSSLALSFTVACSGGKGEVEVYSGALIEVEGQQGPVEVSWTEAGKQKKTTVSSFSASGHTIAALPMEVPDGADVVLKNPTTGKTRKVHTTPAPLPAQDGDSALALAQLVPEAVTSASGAAQINADAKVAASAAIEHTVSRIRKVRGGGQILRGRLENREMVFDYDGLREMDRLAAGVLAGPVPLDGATLADGGGQASLNPLPGPARAGDTTAIAVAAVAAGLNGAHSIKADQGAGALSPAVAAGVDLVMSNTNAALALGTGPQWYGVGGADVEAVVARISTALTSAEDIEDLDRTLAILEQAHVLWPPSAGCGNPGAACCAGTCNAPQGLTLTCGTGQICCVPDGQRYLPVTTTDAGSGTDARAEVVDGGVPQRIKIATATDGSGTSTTYGPSICCSGLGGVDGICQPSSGDPDGGFSCQPPTIPGAPCCQGTCGMEPTVQMQLVCGTDGVCCLADGFPYEAVGSSSACCNGVDTKRMVCGTGGGGLGSPCTDTVQCQTPLTCLDGLCSDATACTLPTTPKQPCCNGACGNYGSYSMTCSAGACCLPNGSTVQDATLCCTGYITQGKCATCTTLPTGPHLPCCNGVCGAYSDIQMICSSGLCCIPAGSYWVQEALDCCSGQANANHMCL